MSLEHSPARQGKRAAYSILEFCAAHGISRATYYNMKKAGIGPREMAVLDRKLITDEAAADWRRDREAAAQKAPANPAAA
jgi:hypothetical protein